MRIILASLLMLCSAGALAQAASSSAGQTPDDRVVVSGTVPDEATKAAVLERLRKLYGAERVVDRLEVGGVVTPANWNRYVTSMIGPDLKQVSKGSLQVQGNTITISGEVPNEAVRQQVLSDLSAAFDAHYGIRQNLRIGQGKQKVLDETLANRTVQFQSGSAVLTPVGRAILDEMAAAILKIGSPPIEIIGNTDNIGGRESNIALSLARAEAVKAYLVGKGIPADKLTVSGRGPDNPIADNATDEGRARNRRIDFRIGKQP
ncbi:MAG: OmpA family protein [Fulvimonas sp.]|nr:OmpA family protein [Fulvimonas sp.]